MKKLIWAAAILGVIIIAAMLFIPSTDHTKLRIGYIPVTHCIPLYVAQQQGLFAAEGLEVELVPLAGGPKILEALMSGDIQVGFSNVVSILLAQQRGLPVIPIAGGPVETASHRDHAILVLDTSDIQEPDDLRGKRIAVNQRQNIDHLMINLYLRQHGIPVDDVELLEVPFPRMEGVLESGAADAIATAEPFITIATEHGRTRILDWNYVAVRPSTFVSTYAVTASFLEQHRSAVVSFANAIARAGEQANSDSTLARRVLTQFTSITPQLAEKVGLPYFVTLFDSANVAETESLLVTEGFIDTEATVTSDTTVSR